MQQRSGRKLWLMGSLQFIYGHLQPMLANTKLVLFFFLIWTCREDRKFVQWCHWVPPSPSGCETWPVTDPLGDWFYCLLCVVLGILGRPQHKTRDGKLPAWSLQPSPPGKSSQESIGSWHAAIRPSVSPVVLGSICSITLIKCTKAQLSLKSLGRK